MKTKKDYQQILFLAIDIHWIGNTFYKFGNMLMLPLCDQGYLIGNTLD